MSAAQPDDQLTQVRTLAGKIQQRLAGTTSQSPPSAETTADIGVPLRRLLTISENLDEPVRSARLDILRAIGRTEAGDQIRRGGACHIAGERAIDLAADTDWVLLREGLREMSLL